LAAGRTFLGIYAPAPAGAAGVILIHGAGVHPDWGLIGALRTQLAEQGYATLSLQMPVMASDIRPGEYGALYPEAAQRIEVGLRFLRAKGFRRIAIVSHSLGARMTNYFLERTAEPPEAWVAIGLSGAFSGAERLKIPVLDLFGERDYADVRDNALARAETLRRTKGSGQIEVAGADHFFVGHEAELVRNVKLFLDRRLR